MDDPSSSMVKSGIELFSKWGRHAAVWFFVGILAWAPFPLGSAVSWGAGLLELLITGCWLLWVLANWSEPSAILPERRAMRVPLALALVVLLWGVVQSLPVVPMTWAHPIWSMTSDALGHPVPAAVSINPWHTRAAVLKLACSVLAFWLAYAMAQRSETASTLFNAVIFVGAAYAAYGFVLAFFETAQAQLIYSIPFQVKFVTGPFMMRNNFATYAGLSTLAAVAKLFTLGSEAIIVNRGPRLFAMTAIHFIFGRGAPAIIAVLVSFAAVVASASRGGFGATICGLAAMAAISLLLISTTPKRLWPVIGGGIVTLFLLVLLLTSGEQLSERIGEFLDAGDVNSVRTALWATAWHMIQDSPWRGLGLGTFQDAYPLYGTQVFPLVMDKAHCDYLEFAAGAGLPMAITWWSALAWLAFLALRGVFARRRNKLFALTAVGATVLVAVHSGVDFSLQIPAIALTYSALLGIGVAQATRIRSRASDDALASS